MSDWQEIFEHSAVPDGPGSDFEERVFAKIHKKKRQKKVGLAITAAAGVLLLLSLSQLFRPTPRHAPLPGIDAIKEEIPLREDLFFSASDTRTRYTLEPVAFRKTAVAQDAAINEI